jgi:hypothetical protein
VDLSLRSVPVGDTTSRKISAASQELRDVLLENLPGVRGSSRIVFPPPITPKAPWSMRLAVSLFRALPPS